MQDTTQNQGFDFSPISSAIREARKERGLSREKLAEICDVSPGYIKSIENTGKNPGFQVFYSIMTELGLSVDKYFYPDAEVNMNSEMRAMVRLLSDCHPDEFYVAKQTVNGLLSRPGRTDSSL